MISDHLHLVDQTEPLVHDVLGGGGAIGEAQLRHSDACSEDLGVES